MIDKEANMNSEMQNIANQPEHFHFGRLPAKKQLELMLNCGMHYPHKRFHPSFKYFLMKGKQAIDLRITLALLRKAMAKAEAIFNAGGSALFVSTKPQITEIVEREAKRCMQYWMTKKWIGGALTNPEFTLHNSLKQLSTLEEKAQNAELYTKKERSMFRRQYLRSFSRLEGVSGDGEHRKPFPKQPPKLVIIVDPAREFTAVKEVLALRKRSKDITLIILGDGFGNKFDMRMLSDQDIFVPGNDDNVHSVELFSVALSDVILDGLESLQIKRNADYALKQELLQNAEEIGSPASEPAPA